MFQPLPFDHCEKFLKEYKNRTIRLFYNKMDGMCLLKYSNNQYILGQGWRDFVRDTELKKHDVVMFKRVYGVDEETLYKVNIFKA